MAKKTSKKSGTAKSGTAKSAVKGRSLNTSPAKTKKKAGQPSSPFAEQDPKRRLGNFVGKGEPARRMQRGGAR